MAVIDIHLPWRHYGCVEFHTHRSFKSLVSLTWFAPRRFRCFSLWIWWWKRVRGGCTPTLTRTTSTPSRSTVTTRRICLPMISGSICGTWTSPTEASVSYSSTCLCVYHSQPNICFISFHAVLTPKYICTTKMARAFQGLSEHVISLG